ncbi:hypothetical protein [Stenotrophomonas sp. YAU14A_MKIMI4_1]|uniref:hypothetical protein n=1 Tax=Stenotrophomonas sp. YAU14A_MKIMI4_1 TaxID=2072408 RepID=UPI000D53E6FE|nr:hypothetical protein [Stenotrophomonas sp. YAU14A_MKIMI4_1]AWH28279.1 hypothetical protein C1931_04715 [Stenotrophomonas sp. YAU14A_MKIMI4_1]
MSQCPERIAIDPDDHYADCIGRTEDGRQFILTTPFEPATRRQPGCEYIALYLFDADGALLDAQIDSLGPRDQVDAQQHRAIRQARLHALGAIEHRRVQVAPFAVEQFGTTFGLVARAPEDEDDLWAVEMQPGNYMAFFEPWDSGVYDT